MTNDIVRYIARYRVIFKTIILVASRCKFVCGSVIKNVTVIRERFAIASRGLEHGPEDMRFARDRFTRRFLHKTIRNALEG